MFFVIYALVITDVSELSVIVICKFINIFRSEINSNSDLINPCNYGAGYPKKLLPMVEKKVLTLQEQYNELINSYYD